MWPDAVGKGPVDYIEATPSLDAERFKQELRQFIGNELAAKLREPHVQVLYDISDEHFRTLNAVHSMKRDRLVGECKQREKLIATTEKQLQGVHEYLKEKSADKRWPASALLAKSLMKRLHHLTRDFEGIRQYQRLSRSMLRTLSLQGLRQSYVAELDHYIGVVALPTLEKNHTDVIIAGVMSAARMFSKREKADDVVARIAMARSRAKASIKRDLQDFGDGAAPVFRTRPRSAKSV
jgi:hypothetical protein